MEVLHLSGYTEEEKVQIAERSWCKAASAHGLREGEVGMTEEAVRLIIPVHARGRRTQPGAGDRVGDAARGS